MNIFKQYLDEFQRHYPQRLVEIRRCKGGYHVLIDGNSDAKVMTEDDFRFAIRNFNR